MEKRQAGLKGVSSIWKYFKRSPKQKLQESIFELEDEIVNKGNVIRHSYCQKRASIYKRIDRFKDKIASLERKINDLNSYESSKYNVLCYAPLRKMALQLATITKTNLRSVAGDFTKISFSLYDCFGEKYRVTLKYSPISGILITTWNYRQDIVYAEEYNNVIPIEVLHDSSGKPMFNTFLTCKNELEILEHLDNYCKVKPMPKE